MKCRKKETILMDGYQKEVAELKGALLYYKFQAPLPKNKGCGAPTHVAGTNGGKMPCGSLLTMSGETKPYYCGACFLGGNAQFLKGGKNDC